MTDQSDPYRVLGVARDADAETIHKAFRRLALRHHPDRNPDSDGAGERFKAIVAAYEILSNPLLRERWNRRDRTRPGGGGFTDVPSHGPFRPPGEHRVRSRPGHDVPLRIQVTPDEIRTRQAVTVRYTARTACPQCRGRGGVGPMAGCQTCLGWGKVRPPPGKFYGRDGYATDCPGCSGTGYAYLTPCPACGGDGLVDVERQAVVRVPAGIESGKTITVQGGGHAGPRGGVAGRLRVEVVVVPDGEDTGESGG
jgi:molecular chaperone DnaJ